MTRTLVTLASIALAWLAVPDLFVHADWSREKLPDGTQVCRDKETGAAFKPPYSSSSQVTVVCNGLTSFIPWLGTAEGQQVGFIKNGHAGTSTPAQSLSAPLLQTDIGSPPTAGTCFDSLNVLTNQGSGDFHKDTSAYHFCYLGKTGDWRISFTLTSLTGSDQYRSCGPAIVDSLAADVKYAYLTPSFATGKANFGGRTTTGAGVYETQTFSTADWSSGPMRLEKIGNTITGYVSFDNGVNYTQVGTTTWTAAGTYYIGVFADSGLGTTNATCLGSYPSFTSLSSSTAGTLNFVAVGTGSASNSTIREDGATFSGPCVARSVDTSGAITVQIQNAGTGTAVAGTDFTNPPYPQTLSWANGEGGTKCGSLAILDRSGSQTSRTVNYALGGATGSPTLGSQTTHTLTITDKDLVAMRTQPGVYAAYNKTCIPYDGVRYGCTKAELLSAVATEVCPHSYIQGMKVIGLPSFFIANTAGVYTATGPDRGFAIFDPVLDALAACGKYLIMQSLGTVQVNLPSQQAQYFPKFTYDSAFNSDGTAAAGTYGFFPANQASQPSGWVAKQTRDDWRDLAIATTAAYCNRYQPGGAHASSAFYAIGMIYWNTSLPINAPLPAGYDEATFNNQYRAYLAGAHAACPTINVLATLDYANPNPAQMSTHLADMRDNTHASMANTDVIINRGGATWGQQVYAGEAGSPSVIDFRGVVRNMEEVESPEMCGGYGPFTPAQFYNIWRNGDSQQRARFPTHIVVFMAAECDPTYGWAAWKAYLATLSGATVMDGHSSTLRTPAYVKANACESSMTCQ